MFMGEYNHTVDAKGRLIVPSKFRDQLGDEFVMTRGLDGCIFVYSSEEWKNTAAKFCEAPQFSKNIRQFKRFFITGAVECQVDKQGRALIPPHLREHAGIEKEIVSAGVVNHIEIWSKDRWQDMNQFDDVEEIAEQMAELGLTI